MSYGLANLAINIVANSAPAQAALQNLRGVAKTSMRDSETAVAGFRDQMDQTSTDTQQAAAQMGGSMEAARAHVVSASQASERALQSLADAANDVKIDPSFSEKIAAALGAGFAAGYTATQGWLQATEAWVETKGKAIVIGLAVVAISATAGMVYAAYRIISGTLGFITGLFTGESYKSANIDALIAVNNEVKDLQTNLNITAQEAGALGDAMARLGVSKPDLVATYKAAEQAMRGNTDELDRLGVKYKDNNGKLLETREFLGNATTKLDEYTVGFDRNAAAAAMGVGSYETLTKVLSVTDAEIQKSGARLADYQITIGPKTQAAVAEYEKAMREFRNETKLTGEGFSRAIADNIMPALTDLAVFFKDGFPVAVRVFRGSMATVTSLLYGLKTVVDMFNAGSGLVGDFLTVSADAAAHALMGDFSGAAKAFADGWARSGVAVRGTWDEMVAAAIKNRDRMIMAFGMADAMGDDPATGKPKGKPWVAKPKDEPKAAAAPASAYDNYLLELDRAIKKQTESEYASMRLRADQLATKEGLKDLTEAYKRIDQVQAGESARAVAGYTEKLREQNAQLDWETSMLGLTTLQVAKLTATRQAQLAAENAITAARQSSKPLTDAAIAQLRAEAAASGEAAAAVLDHRDAITRSASYGYDQAIKDYMDTATNAAQQTKTLVTGQLKATEDAFINLAKTGKLSLSGLFGFMAEEYLRNLFRMQAAKMMQGGFSASGMLGSMGTGLGAVWGVVKSAFGIPLATGTNNVPYDGFQATLHKGEAVVPAAYNPAAGGQGGAGAMHFDFSGQTINVGQGVSRGEVAAALKQQQASTVAQIRRTDRTGPGR